MMNFRIDYYFIGQGCIQNKYIGGDEYTKARKVVIIAITDFEIDITKELKRMETIWNIREKTKSGKGVDRLAGNPYNKSKEDKRSIPKRQR